MKKKLNSAGRPGTFILLFIVLQTPVSQSICTETQSIADAVFWQAHRGGGAHDAPDNTMAAFMYTWNIGGIPEADLRTTKDGVVICLHDATLARTTTAPRNINQIEISELDMSVIKKWDAGVKFRDEFKGERVPALKEVFQKMNGHPEREIYLDIKDVDLKALGRMIDNYAINKQILIASPRQSDCRTLKKITKDLRTMIWIGGSAEDIEKKFAKVIGSKFVGVDQVQLHLNDKKEQSDWRYQLNLDFVMRALKITRNAEIDLEVFPFKFDKASLFKLLDMGIRWYATDEPKRFNEILCSWRRIRATI